MINCEGVQELIEFWGDFDTNSRRVRHIHPKDSEALLVAVEREGFIGQAPAARVEEHFSNLLNDEAGFHLSLMPVPYLGNLTSRATDVFLLLINPVAGYSDYGADACAQFRECLTRNLKQNSQVEKCLALDRSYWWSSWFAWYEERLRPVVREYAHRTATSYLDSLDTLAHRLAVIERVPYYSANAELITPEFVANLESARVAQVAALALAEQAARGEVLVVVVWGRGGLGRPGRFGLERSENVLLNTAPGVLDRNTRDAIVNWLLRPGTTG